MGNYSIECSKASNRDGPRLDFDAFDAPSKGWYQEHVIHHPMIMYVLEQGCMDGLPTSRGYHSNQQPSSYPTLGARVVNSPGATSPVSISVKSV